jgi:PKD repeat protein
MLVNRRLAALPVVGLLLLGLAGCDDSNPSAANGLSVTCQALPTAGVAPLAVVFSLTIAGERGSTVVSVSYGDGTAGNDPTGAHVYRNPGAYTASFTVTGDNQVASCSVGITVSASPGSQAPSGNQPPNLVLKTTPPVGATGKITGPAPLQVQFNMCPSTDPDGDPKLFTMDFEGDGDLDVQGTTGAQCRRGFLYAAGTYRPHLCVVDLTAPGGNALHTPVCQVLVVQAN